METRSIADLGTKPMKLIQGGALLVILIAGGVALGGQANTWRYGKGLGETISRFNIASRRYGSRIALCALIVLVIAVVINGGFVDLG